MAIHIIQLLCPQRHCIMAVAYDTSEMPDDVALAMMQTHIEDLEAKKVIKHECGICLSTDLQYETRRTKFKTKEEAEPALRQQEFDQLWSRMKIELIRANKN